MFKYLIFVTVLVIQVQAQCQAPPDDDGGDDTNTPPPSSEVNVTDAKARLDQASILFSARLLYQMSLTNPDANFVVSGTSISILLGQLAYNAQGKVYDELLAVLGLKSKPEIKSVYQLVAPSYKNQSNVIFEEATKDYVNVNYPLTDQFQEDAVNIFDAEAENIDFSQSKQAADTINNWVANRTHDRITNLLSEKQLDANTVLVLVNVIYFLGNWIHQFNPKSTQKRDFTKRNGDVIQIDTMYQKNSFNYAENGDLNIQALQMFYKNSNFSFLIILPETGCYDSTIENLQNNNTIFNSILNSLSMQTVECYIPKMNIETTVPLTDLLKKLNLSTMFDPSSNGFTGIIKDESQKLYVSDAIQKTFMKFDETGTEAAAATAIGITTLSLPLNPPPVFMANRSFLFYIIFQKQIMFLGGFGG